MTENYASGFTFVPGDEEYPTPQDLRNEFFNENPDVTETTVKYGTVNIMVEGTSEQCENGTATVKYHGSSIVDAPHRPVKYKDYVRAFSDKIIAQKFEPEAVILNDEAFKQFANFLEYELTGPENEPLTFIGDIVVRRKLQRKQGNIGLHIPYYAKHLIVNIIIAEATCIQNYKGKATLIRGNNNEPIKCTFSELSMTYTIILSDVQADSNIVFAWKNDND